MRLARIKQHTEVKNLQQFFDLCFFLPERSKKKVIFEPGLQQESESAMRADDVK